MPNTYNMQEYMLAFVDEMEESADQPTSIVKPVVVSITKGAFGVTT